MKHIDVEEEFDHLENDNKENDSNVSIAEIKNGILGVVSTTLSGVSRYLPPKEIVVDTLFDIIDKESIDSLDGVIVYLHRAFENLYKEKSSIIDKSVAFNLLVTKYEAYLKKLYYIIHGEEVPPQNEGEDVTWANVIHAFSCLWGLKNNPKPAYQQLYQYLILIKGWRNDESHISPTASDQELKAALDIVITMYCFATGASIEDLND